jgi:protein-tyrosine kinase
LVAPGARSVNRYHQAYRQLADQLSLKVRDQQLRAFLVTAPVRDEGATTVVANLGLFFSQQSTLRVLLIDANVRRPTLHRLFKQPQGPGLAQVLKQRDAWEDVVRPISKGLHLLPAGECASDALSLLNSSKLAWLIEQAKSRFDVVLIDCAEANLFQDSLVLAPHVDGITVVIREGRVRRQALQSILAPLCELQEKLMGVILNGRTFPIPTLIYDLV